MRKSNSVNLWATSLAAAAAVATVALSGGTAAFASVAPPDGGGGPLDCAPQTYIYASGSTIHFNGWTRCANAAGFELQIGYNEIDGATKYSGIVTCRGALAGGTTDAEQSCGITGVSGTMTDNKKGSQKWCVNTFITTGGPGGSKKISLAGCINH